jgi:crotonobetainyl-CoA:carnitine CoA-transferase CaiB-like acyl-CoA transferase
MAGENEGAAHHPLAGVRVVEIGSSVAAPYAAWILGSLGADVVKVERPGSGDDARQWGGILPDGSSSYFHALNREKRGITVDLTNPTEQQWLQKFCIEEADVVVQNMRPGRIEKYGLDGDTLTASNPRLIYCNLGAFGNRGPLKDHAGYDPLMQAYGGLMSITGEEGHPPIRVGTSIIDMGTGMWCVIGIQAALMRRAETGKGCIVDASLYETSTAWLNNAAATAGAEGRNPVRQGSGARGMAPYQAYACSDGYLIIAAPNDGLFERLSEVLGHPEWPQEPRFNSNQNRYKNLADLNALMEPILVEQTRDHWRATLDEVGIPSAPVQQTLEMMADPQTEALGIIQQAGEDGLRLMGMPLSFDGERPPLRRYAPSLGEHNDEVKGSND